ncbi:GumC family protein [Brumimicrobium aurantiacum]|uniref:non-specific protein-tyrosine kinase n=1 Tax=Brumimicrobium aurantiacum TaxID=1737063 RepID=A0A3E1EUU2_9FLAO|nr:tyrosine-protein kinase [Brumimicrobium aurantiacum]RFC53331.1 hypothetical protein DXU93_12925 [Brumimicrobium aurantiacum]
MQQQLFDQQPEDNVNIQEIIGKYLQHWKWIVLFTLLFCGVAYIYLKGQPSVYKSTSTVLVKDDKNGSLGSDLDVFADLGLSKGNSNLHNEIEVFKSRDLIMKVVKSLKLNTRLTQKNNTLGPDIHFYHNNSPLDFIFMDTSEEHYQSSFNLEITNVSNSKFSITEKYTKDGNEKQKEIESVKYGQIFQTEGGPLKITKTDNFNQSHINEKFIYTFSSLENATSKWKSKFEVNTVNKDASVLTLSATGLLKKANNDFINQLIIKHEENAISDKNEITKNTSAFIAERMDVIEDELSDVEETNEQFKKDNKLVDVEKNAELFLEQEGEIESTIIETNIQVSLAQYMVDYLKRYDDVNTLLPANLGFQDQSINMMTQKYNEAVIERNRLIQSSNENNPLAVEIEGQLEELKRSITKSLNNAKESLSMRLKELNKESSKYQKRIESIPKYERRYREIQRQQQIKETLYLYLLQKREENEIAMASTIGNVKIIDAAYALDSPVGPKRNIIFLAAFILGIAIPIAFIYIKDLLDNKIRSVEELEETDITVVGDIPLDKSKDSLVTRKGERSMISEAYRMLRTNMKFLLEKKEDEGQVIFLSSTLPGEGKSFTSINLANSLALTDKKVCLVGLDLRAPKLSEYLNHEESLLGASNYLANPDITLDSIIYSSNDEINFDYIFSGDIPPNPSELLSRPRMKDFFEDLKNKYDYIIVDTSPMALVVDTISILEHADLLLYIVKANFAHKKSIDIPKKIQKERKTHKIAFILNGSNRKKGGYGYGKYGYGFGYGDTYGESKETKKWFQFWKKQN